MYQQLASVIGLGIVLIFTATGIAAEKAVTAKVTAVDATKKSITFDDLELDVSRKTKITVDGEKATLADIKKGQQAKVTYDDDLEVATSIAVGKEADGDVEATAKAMKAIQGEWRCIAMEEIGKTLDKKKVKGQDRRVTIKGNAWTMSRTQDGKRGTYTGKFEIDDSNGHFDWIGKGPGGELVEWVGIYELNGDTLKVCYRYKKNDEVVRPKKFKTDEEKPNFSVFYILKRDND